MSPLQCSDDRTAIPQKLFNIALHIIIVHYVCFIVHPVVDVSAQGGCTITPINPTTLTAAGGVLANGTVNVMMQCNCTDDDGMVVERVRWYDPDGTRIYLSTNDDYVAGTPYYRRAPDDTNIILVIPTFNDSFDGTYTCEGRVIRGPPGPPNGAVSLTIGGKFMRFMYSCT